MLLALVDFHTRLEPLVSVMVCRHGFFEIQLTDMLRAMDIRAPFVEEIAKTITDHHEKELGSFIFGISGKWGEGKTHFLEALRKKLEVADSKADDSSFIVVDINPWKFSVDRMSFLRNFIRTLDKKCGSENQDILRQLDVDQSENEIRWRRSLTILAVFVLIGSLFFFKPFYDLVKGFPSPAKVFFTVAILPIVIAAVQSVVTVRRTDHAIATLDKFDDLLEKILQSFKAQRKKIIVFVDDLDRVTPEMARDVLDNLRTFFDKKEITFVVAGDHSVLEGYLGRSLIPDKDPAAQLEEGRRFMKKIFNLYWRLPLPIKKELQDFIMDEFKRREANLNAIFPTQNQREKFSSYLEKYFESNFRQIVRFLDTVLFNFRIIKKKADDSDAHQTPYFKEMLTNPLLVVRILMIQELCAPLFEKMVKDVAILLDLEYAVEKKDSTKIALTLGQGEKLISHNQQTFIEKFIYEEPRFYRDSRLEVLNLQPYLSLAADVSFGDQRGPSGEDFITSLRGGDPKAVRIDLLSMGDEKANAGAAAFERELATAPDELKKLDLIRTLLVALSESPKESTINKIYAGVLADCDYRFVNDARQQKLEILNLFFNWLDRGAEEFDLSRFENKFVLNGKVEFDALDTTESGLFKSYYIANWLKEYYRDQKSDALSAMLTQFPNLKMKDKVREQMDTIADLMVTDIIQDSNELARESRYSLLRGYTTDGAKELKSQILNLVFDLDEVNIAWIIAKTKDENAIWTGEEVEAKVLEKIESAANFNELDQSFRFAIANKIGSPEAIWARLVPKHQNTIVENLPTLIENASLQAIAPPRAYASDLMDVVVKKIKTLTDPEQVNWLKYVVRDKWPWVNLEKYPISSKFGNLKKSKNSDIKEALSAAEESWKKKLG